jgi:transcriptional regulator with XRE-family HTH domain
MPFWSYVLFGWLGRGDTHRRPGWIGAGAQNLSARRYERLDENPMGLPYGMCSSPGKAAYMLLSRHDATNMLLIVPCSNTCVASRQKLKSLLQQIKDRRIALKLKQGDMLMRAGFSRQQYQRLEASGNPRLDTLEVLAKGLDSELLLIPNEKLTQVLAILESGSHPKPFKYETAVDVSKMSQFWLNHQNSEEQKKNLSIDPWDEELGSSE